MRLKNKVAIVTGSNRGIGLSIVEDFLNEGCTVYAGVRNTEHISKELLLLSSKFNELKIISLDVTKPEECKNVFLKVKKELSRIDVVVNNAGIVTYEMVPFIDFFEFEKMLSTNVTGLIRVSQFASRLMSRQKSGSIINISSIVSVKGAKGQAAYAATKGAVNSFSLSLAKELAEFNVRVNVIAPGMVETTRLQSIAKEKFPNKYKDIGIGHMATPAEIAKICTFLASDDSSYITAQIIGADGLLNI